MEIVLDPYIRTWVLLPIVSLTFLLGITRHFVAQYLTADKKVPLTLISDMEVITRAGHLKDNGHYIPEKSYNMRRNFFNDETDGVLKKAKHQQHIQNPVSNPDAMREMMKTQMINYLPTVLVYGWIDSVFSGFLTTRIPFALPLRFKIMLQRGIDLQGLSAQWVSSASWYFLSVFSLRGVYSLILGENNSADQTKVMQDQFASPAASMQGQDMQKLFKEAWETLEIWKYKWEVSDAVNDLLKMKLK